MGSMPAQLLTGADAKDVASFVAATAGRDPAANTATAATSSAATSPPSDGVNTSGNEPA